MTKRTFTIDWLLWFKNIRLAANEAIMQTKLLLRLRDEPDFLPLPGEHLFFEFYNRTPQHTTIHKMPQQMRQDTYSEARAFCVCYVKFYVRFKGYLKTLQRMQKKQIMLKDLREAEAELNDPDFVKSSILAVQPLHDYSYGFICMHHQKINTVKRIREEGEPLEMNPDCPKRICN